MSEPTLLDDTTTVTTSKDIQTFSADGLEEDKRFYVPNIRDALIRAISSDTSHDITSFLERPILVASPVFDKKGLLLRLDVGDLFANSPLLAVARQKLSGFYGFTGTVNFKITINAQPFEQGMIMYAWHPLQSFRTTMLNESSLLSDDLRLTMLSMLPNGYIDIARQSEANASFPHISPTCVVDLQTKTPMIGTFYMAGVVPPFSHQNGTVIPMHVYMYLTDVKLYGAYMPQGIAAGAEAASSIYKEVEEIFEDGRFDQGLGNGIGKTARSLHNIGKSAMEIPILGDVISPFAKPILSVADDVLRWFGFCKPADVKFKRVAPTVFPNIAQMDGPSTAKKMSALMAQKVSPVVMGFTKDDEMSLGYIAKQEGLLNTVTFSITTKGLITSFPVNPNVAFSQSQDGIDFYIPTPLRFLSEQFALWRGTIRFKVMVVCTKFCSGRLRFVYGLHEKGTELSAPVAAHNYSYVTDIRGPKTITLDCPYIGPNPWREVPHHWDTKSKSFQTNQEFHSHDYFGLNKENYLNVYVESGFRVPEGISDKISLIVCVSGGADFEVAQPITGVTAHTLVSPFRAAPTPPPTTTTQATTTVKGQSPPTTPPSEPEVTETTPTLTSTTIISTSSTTSHEVPEVPEVSIPSTTSTQKPVEGTTPSLTTPSTPSTVTPVTPTPPTEQTVTQRPVTEQPVTQKPTVPPPERPKPFPAEPPTIPIGAVPHHHHLPVEDTTTTTTSKPSGSADVDYKGRPCPPKPYHCHHPPSENHPPRIKDPGPIFPEDNVIKHEFNVPHLFFRDACEMFVRDSTISSEDKKKLSQCCVDGILPAQYGEKAACGTFHDVDSNHRCCGNTHTHKDCKLYGTDRTVECLVCDNPGDQVVFCPPQGAESQVEEYHTFMPLGAATSTPYTSTIGEKIHSFRQYLKRYQRLRTSLTINPANVSTIFPFWFGAMDADGMKGIIEPLHKIANAYLFYNGSVRIQANTDYGTSGAIKLIHPNSHFYRHFQHHAESKYMLWGPLNELFIIKTDNVLTSGDFDKLNSVVEVPFSGMIEGGVEIEVPFYSQFAFNQTFVPEDRHANTILPHILTGCTPNVFLAIGFDLSYSRVSFNRAAGDDFSLGCFLGPAIHSAMFDLDEHFSATPIEAPLVFATPDIIAGGASSFVHVREPNNRVKQANEAMKRLLFSPPLPSTSN